MGSCNRLQFDAWWDFPETAVGANFADDRDDAPMELVFLGGQLLVDLINCGADCSSSRCRCCRQFLPRLVRVQWPLFCVGRKVPGTWTGEMRLRLLQELALEPLRGLPWFPRAYQSWAGGRARGSEVRRLGFSGYRCDAGCLVVGGGLL